jgi:enamine deaminase RidA (YjgF/YER057c/UK114 family)
MTTAKFINPETMAKPPGYTHVVEITAPGRLVYIAGQLGFDRTGKLAGGPGDFRAQAIQAFDNLRSALTAVGATFADVVKINSYITDMGHLPIFREVRDRFVNTAAPPASTLVGVTSLAVQGALFEIEAVAMLRS